MQRINLLKRVWACMIACLFAFWGMPAFAWAAEGNDEVDIVPSAEDAGAAESGSEAENAEAEAALEASAIDTTDVILSANDDAALIEGCSFAVHEFKRAQTGTSTNIDDVFYGYHFLSGSDPNRVSLIATDEMVVVYVPESETERYGIDIKDVTMQNELKEQLFALDTLNAHGGDVIGDETPWYFTTEQEYTVNHLSFKFHQELKEGFFYDCVLGEDGSDLEQQSNPYRTDFSHACFATLISADEVEIAAPPTWRESTAKFLTTMDYSPLLVTLKTTFTAIVFIFILGLLAAYFTLHIPSRAQDVADSIFTIPMVLPPTVCGFLLLLLLGRNTFIGRWFIAIGFPLIFSWPATVIAAVVVAFPLMYRSARGAFENLDPNMLDAAKTLGWSNAKIFFKLMLPLSWSSIAAGTVLAFARALGEFGATLFLAGNYLGITRTIPIAIYFEWMNGNTDIALFWTGVIMAFSFIVILFINLWSRHTTRYRRGAIEE